MEYAVWLLVHTRDGITNVASFTDEVTARFNYDYFAQRSKAELMQITRASDGYSRTFYIVRNFPM